MNEIFEIIGAGVVIGITMGLILNILFCIVRYLLKDRSHYTCAKKPKAYTKYNKTYSQILNSALQNSDLETMKLFVKCTGPENSELYTKLVFEVVLEMNNLSKDYGQKRVLEKEIAYLSHQTTDSEMVFNAYRNVWETKHNCKYVSVVDRLMKLKDDEK